MSSVAFPTWNVSGVTPDIVGFWLVTVISTVTEVSFPPLSSTV